MTEKELVDQLDSAEFNLKNARFFLAAAKKECSEAETKLIEAKLHHERSIEALRVYHNTVPKHNPSYNEIEVEKFKLAFPELVEWAKQRDKDRP